MNKSSSPLTVCNVPFRLIIDVFLEGRVPYLPPQFNYPHPIPLAAFNYYKKNPFKFKIEEEFPEELLKRFYESWKDLEETEEKYNPSHIKYPKFNTIIEYKRFKKEEEKKLIEKTFKEIKGISELIEEFEEKIEDAPEEQREEKAEKGSSSDEY